MGNTQFGIKFIVMPCVFNSHDEINNVRVTADLIRHAFGSARTTRRNTRSVLRRASRLAPNGTGTALPEGQKGHVLLQGHHRAGVWSARPAKRSMHGSGVT